MARVQYDGRHTIGMDLAEKLLALAKKSVSQHHGMAHELNVRQLVAQAELLKAQIEEIEQAVTRVNAGLPDYARIGMWVFADAPFTGRSNG